MNICAPSTRRILLIGWDAADWNVAEPLLAAGQMPTLQGLMQRGVWGNLASLMPMVSPMLWTSIATGKTADQHGVHGFVEPDPERGGCRPWSSLTRRGKAVWNILHQHGWKCSTVAWWASHPAEPLRAPVVSNLFLGAKPDLVGGTWRIAPGAVHPPDLAQELGALRMQADEVAGEHILPFIPRAAEINQDEDRHLVALAEVLSSTVSVQAAATAIMEHHDWDFLAVYFDGIDHFCHAFMPYHPPRLPHIPEAEFERYRDVVAGAYRFHDMMLERLLQLAGPEATVVLCSDHGFLTGPHRPLSNPNDPAGPTLWHREMGMLVMAGPGIRSGERVYGASLLDITPTLLTLAGLPCGTDMPGKPLTEALVDFRPGNLPRRIASWDDVPGDAALHPSGTPYGASEDEHENVTRQLVALGYLQDAGMEKTKAAEDAAFEAEYNLAQVHLSLDQAEQAVPLLQRLLEQRPWETRLIHQLACALTRAGWHRQCIDLLLAAYPDSDPELPLPAVQLVLARACLGLGDKRGASFYAAKAFAAMPVLAGAYVELGLIWLELDEYAAAESAGRRALELEPASSAAWELLAEIHLRRHEDAAAVAAALESVGSIWQRGRAHFILGWALARLGRFQESRAALQRATAMLPRDPHPWRLLSALPDEASDDPDNANSKEAAAFLKSACRERSRQLSRDLSRLRLQRQRRAQEPKPFPPLPPPSQRRSAANHSRPSPQRRRSSGKTFTLVSGLPRSGTSLMMQMLAAGGLPPQTDHLRAPDEDNPAGYFEWEAIKEVAVRPELLDESGLEEKAIKCVSALLPKLPLWHRYQVIFMTRPAAEIAESQRQMLKRNGHAEAAQRSVGQELLERHRQEILAYLRHHPQVFDVLLVDFGMLVREPMSEVKKILAFLGGARLPNPATMASVVRPELHRNRTP